MTYLRLLIVQSTHIQKINLLFYRLDTSVLDINFKIPSESNLKEQTILSPKGVSTHFFILISANRSLSFTNLPLPNSHDPFNYWTSERILFKNDSILDKSGLTSSIVTLFPFVAFQISRGPQ